ncbi:MAG: DUF6114 domain-containing protein [Nitrososphaerota archaeon]
MEMLNSSEKPLAIFVLALGSGLIMVVSSIYSLLMWFFYPFTGWYRPMWCPMCGWMMGWFNWFFFIPFVTLTLVSGVIILLGGYMAYIRPQNIQFWGILVIIFSVLSLLGGGGFVVGAILGLVSGILALTWKKT